MATMAFSAVCRRSPSSIVTVLWCNWLRSSSGTGSRCDLGVQASAIASTDPRGLRGGGEPPPRIDELRPCNELLPSGMVEGMHNGSNVGRQDAPHATHGSHAGRAARARAAQTRPTSELESEDPMMYACVRPD